VDTLKHSLIALASVAIIVLPLTVPFEPSYVFIAGSALATAARFAGTVAGSGAALALEALEGSALGALADHSRSAPAPSSPQDSKRSGPIIVNGDFGSGKSNWLFYSDSIGVFTVIPGLDNSSAKILTSKAGTIVELMQQGLHLDPNTSYKLSFSARSSSGHDLSVSLQNGQAEATFYGLSGRVFDLTPEWQTYSVEFTTENFDSPVNDGRLVFWLGPYAEIGDEYWFDNVSLEKADPGSSTVGNGGSAPAAFVHSAIGSSLSAGEHSGT
jgi:hypothetical protein